MKQNSMLAMILAGGRGSRLHDLTNKVAKPAVSYGGKYRIVDMDEPEKTLSPSQTRRSLLLRMPHSLIR